MLQEISSETSIASEPFHTSPEETAQFWATVESLGEMGVAVGFQEITAGPEDNGQEPEDTEDEIDENERLEQR